MDTGRKQLVIDALLRQFRDDMKVSTAHSFRAATVYEAMLREAANTVSGWRAVILSDMYSSGASYAEIGTEVGLTAPRVHYLVQRAASVGVQTNRKE